MTDHDDELGAFLRSEVPEPAEGYWDGIDAMLQRVEDERAAEAAPAPARPQLSVVTPVTEESADNVQTDDDVPRLTDMTTNTTTFPTPNRANFLVLAAAALVAVVGLGSVFAILRDDPTASIDTAEDGTPTPSVTVVEDGEGESEGDDNTDGAVIDDPSDDDATTDDETPDEATGGDDTTDEDTTAAELAGRLCYSDGDLTYTFDFSDNGGTFTGWQVPVGFAQDSAGLTGFELPTAPNGDRIQTLSGAAIVPADEFQVLESWLLAQEVGFSSVSTSAWVITPEAVTPATGGETISYPAVDCATVADDSALVETTFPFFPGEDLRPTTTAEIDTLSGINQRCYTDGTLIMGLNFTDDGVLFNGVISGRVVTMSGTQAFDDPEVFNVAEWQLGDLESGRVTIVTKLWQLTPEAIVIPGIGGDETFTAVDCATVADQVAQAEDFIGASAYPTYPLGS